MAKPMKTLELHNPMIRALIALYVAHSLVIFTLLEVIFKIAKTYLLSSLWAFFFRPLYFKTEQINEMSKNENEQQFTQKFISLITTLSQRALIHLMSVIGNILSLTMNNKCITQPALSSFIYG